MVEAVMQAHDILPRHIERIDVTTGGDHGTVVAKLPTVGETRVVSWVRDAVTPEPLPPAASHVPDLGEDRDEPTLLGPVVEQ